MLLLLWKIRGSMLKAHLWHPIQGDRKHIWVERDQILESSPVLKHFYVNQLGVAARETVDGLIQLYSY